MTHLLESTVHQIFEAKKLIKTLTNGKYTAKVYYDQEWEEYQTKFFEDGKDLGEDVMHHTDDKNDAINTAEAELKFMVKASQNESKQLKEASFPFTTDYKLSELISIAKDDENEVDLKTYLQFKSMIKKNDVSFYSEDDFLDIRDHLDIDNITINDASMSKAGWAVIKSGKMRVYTKNNIGLWCINDENGSSLESAFFSMGKNLKNESKKLKENMQMHPNKIEGFMESMEEKFDSRPFKEVLKDLDNNFDAGLVKAWEKMAKDFDAFSEVFWEKYT